MSRQTAAIRVSALVDLLAGAGRRRGVDDDGTVAAARAGREHFAASRLIGADAFKVFADGAVATWFQGKRTFRRGLQRPASSEGVKHLLNVLVLLQLVDQRQHLGRLVLGQLGRHGADVFVFG